MSRKRPTRDGVIFRERVSSGEIRIRIDVIGGQREVVLVDSVRGVISHPMSERDFILRAVGLLDAAATEDPRYVPVPGLLRGP